MGLTYTLVTDGSSDRTLLSVLDWLCRYHYPGPVEGQWFDPRAFRLTSMSLEKKLLSSVENYPCNILFVHRDSEGFNAQVRYDEIIKATAAISNNGMNTPFICVVPVRMTEAWLLFDEKAIRWAAENPNGKVPLSLPPLPKMETIVDPKELLFLSIKKASDLNARRRKKLNLSRCRLLVAERINDFSPLRCLPAFQRLENDIRKFCQTFECPQT